MTIPVQETGPGILGSPKRQSLPEAIANVVAEAIAARQFVAGERIVETALAARLNVSRVPVREALKVLHTQGIIAGGGHRGFRVSSFSPKMIQSVQEARIELETLILRDALASWQAGTAEFAALDRVIRGMRGAVRAQDIAAVLRADLAFHQVICDAAQNPIFATLWSAIARHVMIILNLARFRDIELPLVVRRHQALRDQIAERLGRSVDLADLRALLQAHFLAERDGPAETGGGARAVSRRASRRRPSGTTPS
jgi:DNA-binding GntR family transcriptional regulator